LESEWTTTEAFQRWLAWLRGVEDDAPSPWSVLSCDSVHRQEATKQYAAKLGIDLLSIPPGLTDERQPLDRPRIHHQADRSTIRHPAWEAVNSAVLNDTWVRYQELEED
jgi:hypothetical protein